jgi:hypothetical protein
MRSFVTPNTAVLAQPGSLPLADKEDAMTTARKAKKNADRDVATLIELLRMEAELQPPLERDQTCPIERLRRDQILLEMWPEACRRTGAAVREFPVGVIKLWKQSLGGTN